MLLNKALTYPQCRCPKCKRPLDYVPINRADCPFCKQGLESVWETRRYPGLILMPNWMRALAWPFWIISGLIILSCISYAFWPNTPLEMPRIVIAIAVISLLFKANYHYYKKY